MTEFSRIINLVPELYKELADYYEVSELTVRRWGSGIAIPLPRMQKCILNTVEKIAGMCSCGLCKWCSSKIKTSQL